MRKSRWSVLRVCAVVMALSCAFVAPANDVQRHILDASINLGWVSETLAAEGRTAANAGALDQGMAFAEAHVRAMVGLLPAPYQDLDFSVVLARLDGWDAATARNPSEAALYVQQIHDRLRATLSVYLDARTQRLVRDGNCDAQFAHVGFHFGRAHIAGLRGDAVTRDRHLGSMRQAIRGGLRQDQVKLCGFGVEADWDDLPVLLGDASADGFWRTLVSIQAIALQARRGGGRAVLPTSGAVPPPPSPSPPFPTPAVLIGSGPENPAPSCRHILHAGGSTGDGLYWLDPRGGDSFPAFCDMTNDGGGWTLYAIGADLSGAIERPSVTDPGSLAPQVLQQDRAQALATVSGGLFRISDPRGAQSFYIRDTTPLFASDQIGGFGRGHVWATNAGSVECATSYAQVNASAMASTGTFAIDCESRGPGSHACGTVNGWILFHAGGTYDYDGQHPCSFGHGQSPGLVVRWIR